MAEKERSEDRPSRSTPGRRDKRRQSAGSRRPVLRFVLLFAVLMGVFELAFATSFVKEQLFPAYLRINANVSAGLLRVFREPASAMGASITGRYPLTIERGCDAIEPSALFLAGVLAFPVRLMAKVPGMLIGTVCLMLLNLVRIVSLYYVGVHMPRWFHVMHVDVWQPIFIVVAIAFWVLWALWATREMAQKSHAARSAG